jgi:hypothetical protein
MPLGVVNLKISPEHWWRGFLKGHPKTDILKNVIV